MRVFVLDKNRQPLDPCHPARARKYPDDVDETWDRMIFRPGLGYQNICVTRSDHPLLDLRDWDTIADTPGGPITLAQVRHFLSLDVPSVADAASLPF